ncbi:hypothetical protein [Achromobacter xylosoxidans]|uniref:hypothetical protein n=1 Tax=Alcaligenes xylosoxydans xylosoxydans TaxID=85698 RepID=UPI00167FE325|nr:hypothetical protein [Achromobacter xylosoxidans]
MTEFEITNGLSQDAPGPLEPVVEIAQQPGAAPATGNTARDQEMYAAGIRTGEENAKHNAAIRAGVPEGWKLLAKKTCYALMHDGAVIATLAGPESEANAAIIARMLAAPGVSTVEDEREGWRIDNSAGRPILVRNNCSVIEAEDAEYVLRLIAADRARAPTFATSIFGERIGKMLDGNAPAAGDALDAARYRWLRVEANKVEQFGSFSPYVIQGQTANLLSGESLDACVDAAIAAQRKGGA